MSAVMVDEVTPLACASPVSCLFHASKPAAVLPHCAALALPLIHTRGRGLLVKKGVTNATVERTIANADVCQIAGAVSPDRNITSQIGP
jgi:hypothetical protein